MLALGPYCSQYICSIIIYDLTLSISTLCMHPVSILSPCSLLMFLVIYLYYIKKIIYIYFYIFIKMSDWEGPEIV